MRRHFPNRNFSQYKHLLKQFLLSRDAKKCCYCDKVLSLKTASIEHIVPISFGGTFHNRNLTIACMRCNSMRKNKDLIDYLSKLDRPNLVLTRIANLRKEYFFSQFFKNCERIVKNLSFDESIKQVIEFFIEDERVRFSVINEMEKLGININEVLPSKEMSEKFRYAWKSYLIQLSAPA